MFAGLRGAVCQWHTFSTDRSEYEDTKHGAVRLTSKKKEQYRGGKEFGPGKSFR